MIFVQWRLPPGWAVAFLVRGARKRRASEGGQGVGWKPAVRRCERAPRWRCGGRLWEGV